MSCYEFWYYCSFIVYRLSWLNLASPSFWNPMVNWAMFILHLFPNKGSKLILAQRSRVTPITTATLRLHWKFILGNVKIQIFFVVLVLVEWRQVLCYLGQIMGDFILIDHEHKFLFQIPRVWKKCIAWSKNAEMHHQMPRKINLKSKVLWVFGFNYHFFFIFIQFYHFMQNADYKTKKKDFKK